MSLGRGTTNLTFVRTFWTVSLTGSQFTFEDSLAARQRTPQGLADGPLMTVEPAGDPKKQHLDLWMHPHQETVCRRTAQAAMPLRPDQLA